MVEMRRRVHNPVFYTANGHASHTKINSALATSTPSVIPTTPLLIRTIAFIVHTIESDVQNLHGNVGDIRIL